MSQMRNRIGTLAQNNYYYVEMSGLPQTLTDHLTTRYRKVFGDLPKFTHKLGFLCSEATLPTSAYATAETKNDFMGVTQEFAHTRIYTDLDMTFYVDSKYKVLKFFEGWMDYVGGGSEVDIDRTLSGSAYRRFNYPKDYKMNSMRIYKFERDYKQQIKYTFVNLFPKSIGAVSVAYGAADILKVTVSFNFDRYVVNNDNIITKESYQDSFSNAFTPTLNQDDLRNSFSQPLDLGLGIDYNNYAANFEGLDYSISPESVPLTLNSFFN